MSETLEARAPDAQRTTHRGRSVVDWTPELRAKVLKLWGAGHSAGQIGIALGMSRSAVIGMVHRHNLATEGRRVPATPRAMLPKPEKPKPEPKPRKYRPKPPPPPPSPAREPRVAPPPETAWKPLEGSKPLPWTQRPFGACAWPVGFADDGETLSCCEPVREGPDPNRVESFCFAHGQRAYYPPKENHARFSRGVRRWAK